MERGHAEAIAPMVAAALHQAGTAMADVHAISVTVGPGTFTGLRVGLAMAQGLALPGRLPLIPITSLQATALGITSNGANITVCHQAGASGQFYMQRFDQHGAALNAAMLQDHHAVHISPEDILVGSGAHQFIGHGHSQPQHDLPDARLFASYARKLPKVDAAAVQPLYMRSADAKLATVTIQRVGAAHASTLSKLHQSAFAKSWSAADLDAMLAVSGTLALLASAGTVPVGFILLRTVAGEAEILTLATSSTARRKGVARRLLQAIAPYLNAMQCSVLHLEVSADNAAALALYRGAGFDPSGLRRGYYTNQDGSVSDAVLMRRDFP